MGTVTGEITRLVKRESEIEAEGWLRNSDDESRVIGLYQNDLDPTGRYFVSHPHIKLYDFGFQELVGEQFMTVSRKGTPATVMKPHEEIPIAFGLWFEEDRLGLDIYAYKLKPTRKYYLRLELGTFMTEFVSDYYEFSPFRL